MIMKDRFTKNDVIPPTLNKYAVLCSLQLPQICEMQVSFPSLSANLRECKPTCRISFDNSHKPLP